MAISMLPSSSAPFLNLAAVKVAIRGGRILSSLSWLGTSRPGRGCLERMELNIIRAVEDNGQSVPSTLTSLSAAQFTGVMSGLYGPSAGVQMVHPDVPFVECVPSATSESEEEEEDVE